MSDLSGRIAALSPQQRAMFELLKSRQEKKAATGPPSGPIPRREGSGPAPLSFDQERLWFLHRIDPGDTAYNLPTVTRIRGRLDLPLILAALNEVVRRHEAWRTVLPSVDGRPVQVVLPHLELRVPLIDLRGIPAERRHALALEIARELGHLPFDFDRGPLVRAGMIRLTEEEHHCVLVVHHIVTDWLSSHITWSELGAIYLAFAAGRPSPLPEPPIQYADFAVWQRGWMRDEALQRYVDFWVEEIAGAPQVLELPTDRPRPPFQTTRGAQARWQVPREPADSLRALARQGRATSFMALLSVYGSLLHRLTGEAKILISAPNANRNRLEIQQLIGFFLTQVVFAVDLADDPTFGELLERTRGMALRAFAHQDLPFGKLIEAVRPERDPSRSPLVQVDLLVLDDEPASTAVAGMVFEQVQMEESVARFDLGLAALERPDGISGFFEYNRDLFDASTVARLARAFESLIEQVGRNPQARLSELSLLGEGARHQVLQEWNDTAVPVEAPRVDRLFDERAAATPEAVALVTPEGETTYGELRRRADALAAWLRRQGIGREARVGLCVERTADIAVGMLGVWKAGAAWVPLDPGYPPERLAWILEDAALAAVVTRPGPASRLPETGVPLLSLDLLEGEGIGEWEAGLPGDLAYVIYTSGTTGRPKGVMVEHGNLAHVLRASRRTFGWNAADRIPVLAPFSFDIFLFELWSPLTAGGAAELVPLAPALDLPWLMAALERSTRLHAVPALMRQIVALSRAEGRRWPGISTIFVGGDAVPPELLAELPEVFPAAEVRVLYGPTEGTIICASFRADEAPWPDRGPKAWLGRPLPDTELRLVDRSGGLAAIGVPGEIWIGGAGVTRGYLGREDLTAAKYVERDGRRWYRTGDLARWMPDGLLEFLGRVDEQVKVRGFRIEPGEIETALLEQPSIREAVVLAVPVEGGDKRLVAYVVPESEGPWNGAEGEVRAALARRLPEHMVPGTFVALPELPLTSHGKVDRPALQRLGFATATAPRVADPTTPRTPAEQALTEIWGGLLGLESVGVHDNFFRLGGDSILGIQVVARARQAGLAITPRQIFESQTIAALAAIAAMTEPVTEDTEAEQGLVEGEAPLTPVQLRFLEEGIDPEWFDQALLLDVRQPLDARVLAVALEALAGHHDALRLRFPLSPLPLPPSTAGEGETVSSNPGGEGAPSPASRGRVGEGAHFAAPAFPLKVHDLSAASETLEAACAEIHHSLDLENGPLARAALFELGGGRGRRLLLVIHHLVVDAVSWRILLEDLQTAYGQLAAGAPAALPPKTTSWKRWAERLQAHARTAAVRAEMEHWLALPVPAPLPADLSGVPEEDTVGAAATVSVELPAEATAALLREAPAAYHTRVDDLLLTALAQAFAHWTGEPRLILELEGHGREELGIGAGRIDLSRTVGWFTAVYPVALDLAGASGPGEAIKTVKEQLRSVPGKGLGYGLLRYLAADGSLADRPEPQVGFNYLGQLDSALPAGGAFAPAPESAGPSQSPRARRRHRIDVDTLVWGGRLRIDVTYASAFFARETAERLAGGIAAALQKLVAHCLSPQAGGWTPSDFPLARLGQPAFDRLIGSDPMIEDVYPLAPLQTGMLFHTLYTPGSEIYFEQLAGTLRGPLDVEAFARAWQAVADRQPVLRTAFVWDGLERPLQIVRRGVEVPWTLEDWRGEGDPEARFRALVAADRERGFDLEQAPLLRLALARTGEAEHRLLWSFHHLLFDGWCFSILFGEVFLLYEGFRRGETPALEPVRPYRDYIAWLERQDPALAESFWRGRLAGVTAATPVPFDDPAAPAGRAVTDFREVAIRLPEPLARSLARVAQEEGLTLNTLVQGAWALLLARWSGGHDVVFGAVVAGRPAELPGVERMVGLFINTLPVRATVDSAAPAADWLRRLQEEQVEQRGFAWSPLSDVQRWSGVPSGEPLFHSLLVFENYPIDPSLGERLGDLEIADMEVSERTNYPLTLAAVVRDEFFLRLGFDQRIEPAIAERMLAHLEVVLAALAENPHRRLGSLPVLPEEESLRAMVHHGRRPAVSGISGGGEAPRHAMEETLSRLWRSVLRLERVGLHDNFFALGGDSILSLQIVARARQEGLALTPRDLFENPTVATLAAVARPVVEEVEEERGEGEVPLTPIQRFFLAQESPEPGWFNQSVLLAARGAVDPAGLARAVALLPERHDALRWRLVSGDRAVLRAAAEAPFLHVDLSALPEELFSTSVEAVSAQLQTAFDLQEGPLFLAALFTRGEAARLLLTAHHLIVDAVSWRVLLEDLESGRQMTRTTSWKRWSERIAEHARSAAVRAELGFWLSAAPGSPLPVDRPDGPNTEAAVVETSLSVEATEALLRQAPAAWRTRVDELLVTALARTLARWTGAPRVRVDLEGHGREEIAPGLDLSRTVGWFTAVYPVTLDLTGAEAPGEAVRAVKEQLRAVPGRGLGWGLLRWMGDAETADQLAALPPAKVLFDYLGRIDSALPADGRWEPAPEDAGRTQSPRAPRAHLLEINAMVVGGRLRTSWAYAGRHDRATIERLAESFRAELEAVIAACLEPGAGGWTPADFPLTRLDQPTLDTLLGGDRTVEDVYPVAPLQNGMIFHTLFAPGSEIYFEQLTATLRGPLDPDAFARAWHAMMERQPVLRTAYAWEGLERPLQIVRRDVALPWTLEDWREEADPEARLRELAAADRARGLDLTAAPLMRLALLRTGDDEHRLLWSFHHLLFDGWCFSLLFREVFLLYESFRRGEPVVLEGVRPYRDYIAWLDRQDPARAEAFWRARLAGVTAATPVPFDLPDTPAGRTAADFRVAERFLSEPLARSLARLAQDAGLTLNTVVQGAWALLLSRWSGRRDVVFGAVVAGRPADLPGIETMIGLFINTLPVRAAVDPQAPALRWLRRLQEEQVEQRVFEWSPLADVQRWSGVESGAPLFHSLVVFENYPVDPSLGDHLGGLEIRDMAVSERTNYPLTLGAMVRDEFHLGLSHDRRVAPETAERILEQLEAVLAALAADPGRTLGSLPVLPGEEALAALARPDEPREALARLPETTAAEPPRNPVEESLARIWRSVLRREDLGIHDDFFRGGGDSILSLQIVARARQEGLVLTPRQIFENPTIAGQAAVAEVLSREAPPAAVPEPAPLVAPEVFDRLRGGDPAIEDLYPLAPLQKAMVLHGLWEPGSDVYLEQLWCVLRGELDPDAFRGAWQRVVDRHPALRTAFAWEGLEEPLQVVRRGVELPWETEDWRGLSAAEQDARWAERVAADRGRVFDLARPPLQRMLVARMADGEHRFLWSFHHLLFDGWCFSLIFRDVFLLYEGLLRGEEPELPEPRPYREFIAWLAARPAEESEVWWRRRLAGFTAASPLPLDSPAMPEAPPGESNTAEPGERGRSLSAAVTAELEAFAQSQRLTLNTLFQGAWALLLARFGAGRDVVAGSVVSGRPPELPGVESMVGLFINTLPLRLDVDPDAPAAAWLQGVQEAQLDLGLHEHVPIAELQGWSELPPGEPLFRSLTVFEKFPYEEALSRQARGLEVRDLVMRDRADVPLSVVAVPTDEGLHLAIAHDHRTEPATADRLLAHLERLITGLAEDPARPLRDIPLLAAAERSQLLAWGEEGWRIAGPESEEDLCVHQLFARRAGERPDAPALLGMDGASLSYGELAERVGRLAGRLRGQGVGPEERVAVWLERSPRMIEAVLAVHAAGGAYVPIDPEAPPERVALLLEDSGALLLLTEEALAETLPAVALRVVLLDKDEPGPVLETWESDPDHLAYVLYTSGSTGTPKGVLVSHRSLAAYVRAIRGLYEIGPADRAIQFASLSFDASAEEIFTALTAGASLLVRSGPVEDAATFLQACAQRGLTLLSLPTAYWHQLAAALDAGEAEWPAGVRLVVMGGERALPERWAAWGRGNGPRPRLFNAYGPTEATIASTVEEHPGRDLPAEAAHREVSIGRPLPGWRAHVLDAGLGLLPAGATGELFLGGVGLARGYLGDPARTAERFVPDPLGGLAGSGGERLYRTGDRARWLPDGSLEFAGRIDTQVKVRGFRIELGEVEAALATHPDVREAAAVTRLEASGNARLVGFVVWRGEAVDLSALQSALQRRLPAWMVPSEIVPLAALPVTAAGKLDRRALERLAPEVGGAREVRPPSNPVEQGLAEIWSELLGVERVGLDDDFFALGGHSLLATQLVARVRQRFGVDLPLHSLFQMRTLEDLSREVLGRTLDEGEGDGDMDRLLAELDDLSDEEALALLAEEEGEGEGGA